LNDNELFKKEYTSTLYEVMMLKQTNELSDEDLITRILDTKLGVYSSEFKNENFIDQQETRNIEEPPKSRPGIHTCYKCLNDKTKQKDEDRGKRTWYYELQTRSCDEPMTCFITCLDCGNRWKQ
jgi:DNA-directed RNA polymerase subunit M/transcription elongation factor TFIIS